MKDERYWTILNHAVHLEVTKGHLRWTMAELARGSRVSRTLIYYYFGKSKQTIIDVALKVIADEVFGLSPERLELWKEGQIVESVMRSRQLIEQAPQFREFYFHWRHRSGEICDYLIQLEKRYLQKLQMAKPSLSTTEAHALLAVNFGLVMLPALSRDAVEAAVSRVFGSMGGAN